MNAPKNPKRNHHHVWQAYLKPWLVDDEIWCLENGVGQSIRTKKVCVDRDFYQLSALNALDLANLSVIIDLGPKELRELNRELVDLVTEKFRVYEQVQHPTAEMKEYMLRHGYEVLENYHEKIENAFAPLLARSLAGDLKFYYHGDEVVNFLRYLTTQLFRTKGARERSMAIVQTADATADFSRIWGILIHIFSNNLGKTLYAERRRRVLQLLRNNTAIPFVTSDQPVVNLNGNGDGEAPEELALYYPISPDKALYLGALDDQALDEDVNIELVQYLNMRMKKASYRQVFARREHDQ